MKSISLSLLVLAATPLTSAHADADAVRGKAISATCVACHGPEGRSMNPLWPNLAGQKPAYLAKQLKAFRDGTRADPLMMPAAKSLSDTDVEDLAAYFSRVQPKSE